MDTKLKPCKFCGKTPSYLQDWSSESDHDFYCIGCFDTKCPGFVQRGAWDSWYNETGWCDSEVEAIEVWNIMN